MAIPVRVVNRGRKQLVLRWVDPETGATRERSAGTSRRSEAQRVAGKLQAELEDGRYVEPSRVTWAEVRDRFEDEKLSLLAESTRDGYNSALGTFERDMRPYRVADVKTAMVSSFKSKLGKRNLRTATIATYCRHLKAFLRWAEQMGYLNKAPKIELPKVAGGNKVMRGRPITCTEFKQLMTCVPDVVGEENAESWRHYLQGIWLSGLRVKESLQVYWDRTDRIRVDLTEGHPMLLIPGEFEKGRQNRIQPIAPEFAEFLLATPEAERTGPVFDPQGYLGERPRHDWVSQKGSAIGKAAGIVVDEQGDRKKYASLHDFRRAFGERWAARLLPQQLRETMRHESIETTLKYYVGQDAQRTADVLWQAYEKATGLASGDTSGDNTKIE